MDREAVINAVKHNVEIIELHVTLNKDEDYIDNNVSFDFNECDNIINDIQKYTNSN